MHRFSDDRRAGLVLRNARFMPHMYILKCSDGSFYVGSTRNLERRLEEHSTGFGAAYTRTRLPVELVFAEEYEHVHEAYEREKQVQGWSRKKRIALIERRADDLPELSKKRRPRSSFTL